MKKSIALICVLAMTVQLCGAFGVRAQSNELYSVVSKFCGDDTMSVVVKADENSQENFSLYAVLFKDDTLYEVRSCKSSEMQTEKTITFERVNNSVISLFAWDTSAIKPLSAVRTVEMAQTSVQVSHVTAAGLAALSDEGVQSAHIRVPSYASGDLLRFTVSGTKYMWVKAATNLPEYLIYAPTGIYDFPIPAGEALHGYSSADFQGVQDVSVRAATAEDLKAYRNVALNGIDYAFPEEINSPTAKLYTLAADSPAEKSGKVLGYPHAYANRVTRNEGAFYSRNAIDGISNANMHGYYPAQSWGGGNYEDLTYSVYFGRAVSVDKIVVTLRSDYNTGFNSLIHDSYWEGMVAEFSDGSEISVKTLRTSTPQEFAFPERTTEWVRLKKLAVHDDETTQMYVALNELEVWGRDVLPKQRVTSSEYESDTVVRAIASAVSLYNGAKGGRYMAALAKAYTLTRDEAYYDTVREYAAQNSWTAADAYSALSYIELWKHSPADYKIESALSYALSDANLTNLALAAEVSLLTGDETHVKNAFANYENEVTELAAALSVVPEYEFTLQMRASLAEALPQLGNGAAMAYALLLGIREDIFEYEAYFDSAKAVIESEVPQQEAEAAAHILALCEMLKLCGDYEYIPSTFEPRDVSAAPVIEDGYLINAMSAEATAAQSGNGAENLINNVYTDAATGSRWAAANFPQSATITLNKEMYIDKIIIQPYGYRHYYYNLYTSNDGVNYTKIGDDTSLREHYNLAAHNVGGINARYIKLEVTGLKGNITNWISIKEMFVYAREIEFEAEYDTIMSQLKSANDYWISANSTLRAASNPWEVGVFHTGNMQAYYMTGDELYRKYSTLWSKANLWEAYPNPNTRLTFADNMACMQTYIDLYNIDKDEKYIEQAINLVDVIVNDVSTATRFGDDYWFWVDAFYMAAPIFTKIYRLTGDTKYLDKMYAMIKHTAEDPERNCYDEEEKLWYRDAAYVYPKRVGSDESKKVFWSRGNGWVFGAFAKILEDMPDNYAHKDYFESTFRDMAEAIKACQRPEGGWSPSLLDYDYSPQVEESGTGFFVYGLFWGMNNGLLEENEYLDCAMKGWEWLSTTAFQPSGAIGYVQPIGVAPTQALFTPGDIQPYGQASFVFAASEAAKMLGGVQGDIFPMLQQKLAGNVEIYKKDAVYYIKDGEIAAAPRPMLITDNETVKILVDDEYKDIEATLSDMEYLSKYGDIYVVGEKEKFFNKTENNMILSLDEALSNGAFAQRPQYDTDRIAITLVGLIEDGENMLTIPDDNVYASYVPQSENAPGNVVDRMLTTRYSAEAYHPIAGIGASGTVYSDEMLPPYLEFDLVNVYDIDKIGIAFYQGASRTTSFSVSVSQDGKTFEEVIPRRSSSGTSEDVEYYSFASVKATKIRLYGYGNSASTWFSPSEVEVYALNSQSALVPSRQDAVIGEKSEFVLEIPQENIIAGDSYDSEISALSDRDYKTVFRAVPSVFAAGKTDAYIEYNLAQGCAINRIGIAFENSRHISYFFDVEYTADGENYQTLVPLTSSEYTDGFAYFDFETVNAKRLRFNLYGNENDNFSAVSEIELYSTQANAVIERVNEGVVSISPSADAYIGSAASDAAAAKGTTDADNLLVSMNAGAGAAASRRDGLLKFDLTEYDFNYIVSAKLKMYVKSTTNSSTRIVSFYPTASSSWSENTVTWNNAPQSSGEVIGSFAVPAATSGTWFEADITDYIAQTADKTVSLRLGLDTAVIYFASKEYSSGAFAPALEIEYAAAPPVMSLVELRKVDTENNLLAETVSLGEKVAGKRFVYSQEPQAYIEKDATIYAYMPDASQISTLVKAGAENIITLVYRQVSADEITQQDTLIDQGAWCWFADPRAIHHVNAEKGIDMTYIGAIDNAGTIKAFQRNNKTGEEKVVTIRANYQRDDHDNPTFLILPDDRVMIFYSEHTSNPYYHYKISAQPGDLTVLGEEKQISTSGYGNFTYPNPFIMSDQEGCFYLCWRGKNWHPTIAKYTLPDANDNITTVINPTQIVQSSGARPYVKYQSNGKDKIYLTYTTGHPTNENPNWIYYSVLDINTMKLYDVTGGLLGDISSAPYRVNKTNYNSKLVVDNASYRDWVWDITIAADGNPVIAMVRINAARTDHNYYYAKWTGSEWKKTFIANAGGAFHDGSPTYERCYSAGMTIDHKNPNVLYVSQPVKGVFGEFYEIYRYVMNNDWEVESAEAITKNSRENNVRPYMIRGTDIDDTISLIWMSGKYYAWSSSGSSINQGYPTAVKTLQR
ncbi:MAG: glycoside hydrolase family 88 protein [Clostridia bacterium]|nr:glycoside hydrolase family 88 protein [Clostridia bacterium]